MTVNVKIPPKVQVKQAKIILGIDRIDNSLDAYHNLMGAIVDIDNSPTGCTVDHVSMNTLKRVLDQLRRLHKLLGQPL